MFKEHIQKTKNSIQSSFFYILKRNFPRGVELTKKANYQIDLPALNPEMKKKEKQRHHLENRTNQKLIDELDKPLSEEEETEDEIDEKINLGWGKREEIELDPYHEKYLKIAKCNETLMEIPENIQLVAHKVFSKHVYSDIRYWTSKFLLNYCQNHACEPPINLKNLDESRPLFGNSEELNIKVKLFGALNEKEKKQEKKEEGVIDIAEEKKLNKEKENLNPIKVEYKPAQCVAYLYSRMPYTYQVAKRICFEIRQRIPDFHPEAILDYGSGLGSSIWAAQDSFVDCEKFAAVEPNVYMRKLGRFLTSTAKLKSEIVWVESLTMIPGTGSERGKFDLIFLSYVLQEVSTSRIRLMLIETLYNRLRDNGILVVIEPGTPKGFRFIYDLRQWVLNKPREDVSIIAPCPHHLECPMAERKNDWCHFSQLSYKWDRTIIPRSPKEKQIYNEKFCYLVIRKGKTPNAIEKNEEDVKKDEDKSFFWERILRPIIKKQRHSILDLCTTQGKFERRIVSKSHGTIGGYKTTKRLNWGDLWYVPYWLPNKFRKEKLRGKRLW